jgi:uncharacterized protein with HEPN domain
MRETDEANLERLRHMLDAAHKAIQFAEGESRETLDHDEKLQFAIVRALEIIGEAAGHVTNDFRQAHPQIEWVLMVGMRHRIVHAYFEVDLNIVWDTVMYNLPPLIAELEKLV